MRANRKTDTGPELRLRRQLHRMGLRYRLRRRVGTTPPVRPDLVFLRHKVAVFVDGCFWHGCPMHGVQPTVNATYWTVKLALNQDRDKRVDGSLVQLGWSPIRVWEHDDPAEAAARIRAILQAHSGEGV